MIKQNKKLRDYQKVAIQKLAKHYLDKDKGMLILPTGGGKTYTAVKFVSAMFDSKQWDEDSTLVIWLAHTIELINQTKDGFIEEFGKDRIAVISSQSGHSKWKDLNKKQAYKNKNLIFASYLSCSKLTKRKGKYRKDHSLDEMKDFVRKSKAKNVFLVIDEAHRATAKTYRNILDGLNDVKEQKNNLDSVKLLGLTATPIRMSQMEQEKLHHLFDSNKIFEISTVELQNQGVLSRLHTESIPTGNDEKSLFKTNYDALKSKLDKGKKLNNEMLIKIGESLKRNQLIVDHYLKNRDTYGPTIVFATSINHCETLVERFKKEVRCAAVHSNHKDYTIADNIARFKAGKLDVLVNVNMLTEGVDIPNAKTAFLTRPTNSEALLRQMVGRVLRGPSSKGTEIAYAVDFEDNWDKFSPISAGYLFKGEDHELEDKEYDSLQLKERIPIEVILEISRLVEQEELLDGFTYNPVNYYSWKTEEAGEILNNSLITYDNWDYALQNAIDKVKSNPDLEITAAFFNNELGDCEGPIPRNERDFNTVIELLEIIQNDGDYEVFNLDEITQWSPSRILKKIGGKNPRKCDLELEKIYQESDYLRNQYKDEDEFFGRVFQEYRSSKNNIIFNPDYKQWDKPNEDYEIDAVYKRVLKSNIENSGKFKISPEKRKRLNHPRYSSAPKLPSAWGFCQEEPYFHEKINVVLSPRLNSPDIPLMFAEFIMYHELVHVEQGYEEGHGPEFTKWEKMFKPSVKAVNDLRHKFPKYNKRITKEYTFYKLCKKLQKELCN